MLIFTYWTSSGHSFESRVRTVCPSRLGDRLAVHHHDIRGEVKASLEEPRSHAVPIHRNLLLLELPDLVRRKAAGHDNLDLLAAGGVERAPDIPHQLRVDAGGLEVPHLGN